MHNPAKIQQLIKKGIEDKQYPRFVYKYRVTIDNPFFDSIITAHSMMFASPVSFNDPFDCQLQPLLSQTAEEVEGFVTRMLPGLATVDKQRIIDQATKNPEELAAILKKAINFDEKGVLCFSKEPDNILLWSYYAANHRGVCLKFDITNDFEFFTFPLNINYSLKYPTYNHFTDSADIVNMMIKTKHKLWQYEKEIRIVKLNKGVYPFKKTCLTEIIFGCNTPSDEILRIRNLADANGFTHLAYKKAEKMPDAFGIILKII